MALRSMGLRAKFFADNKDYNKAADQSGKKTEELGKKGEKATGDIQKGLAAATGAMEGMTHRIGGVAGQFTRLFSGITSGSATATAGLLAVAGGVAAITSAVKTSMTAIDAYGEQQHAERLVASQMRGLGGSFSSRNSAVKAIMNRLSYESGYDEVPILSAMRQARGMGAGSFNAIENLTREGMRLAEIEGDASGDAASKMVTSIAGVSGAWGGNYGDAADWITRLGEMTGQDVGFLERPIAKSLTGAGLGYGQDFMGGLMTEAFQSGMIPRTAASAVENLVTELVKPNSVLGQMFRENLGMPIGQASGEQQLKTLKEIAKNTDPQEVNLTTTTAPLWGVLANLNPAIANQFSAGAVSGAADERYGDIVEGSIVSVRRKVKESFGDIMEEIGAAVEDKVLPQLLVFRDFLHEFMDSDEFKKAANSLGEFSAEILKFGVAVMPAVSETLKALLDNLSKASGWTKYIQPVVETLGDAVEVVAQPLMAIKELPKAIGEASRGEWDKALRTTYGRMIENYSDLFANADAEWALPSLSSGLDQVSVSADSAASNIRGLASALESVPNPAAARSMGWQRPAPIAAGMETAIAGARLAQSASHFLQGREVSPELVSQATGLKDFFAKQFAADGYTSGKEQQTLNRMQSGIDRMVGLLDEIAGNTEPSMQDLRLYSSPIMSNDDLLTGG